MPTLIEFDNLFDELTKRYAAQHCYAQNMPEQDHETNIKVFEYLDNFRICLRLISEGRRLMMRDNNFRYIEIGYTYMRRSEALTKGWTIPKHKSA